MELEDEAFWRFAWERQAIWHRRYVGKLEPPWTDDPVLAEFRFCNVHRELDAGTIHLARMTHEARRLGYPLEQVVLCIMTQRYFNQPDVEWHPTKEAMVDSVRRRLERTGTGIFARTWMTNGSSWRAREVGFRTQLLEDYAAWDAEKVAAELGWDRFAGQPSMEALFKVLCEQGCIGQVIGWQQALDLTYVSPALDDDTWVPPMRVITKSKSAHAHGPATSTELIAPGHRFQDVVLELRDRQHERLANWGLSWAEVAWANKPRLTLADVEHTLCEWARYRKHVEGKGRRRRLNGPGFHRT